MNDMPSEDCFVCRKHRDRGPLMPGGPIAADELTLVSHIPPGPSGAPAYLGHLFVEPRRHVPGLADLTDAEASAAGLWCARASRALRLRSPRDKPLPLLTDVLLDALGSEPDNRIRRTSPHPAPTRKKSY